MAELAVIPEVNRITHAEVDGPIAEHGLGLQNHWTPVLALVAAVHQSSQENLATNTDSSWNTIKNDLWNAALSNLSDHTPRDVSAPMSMDDLRNTLTTLGIPVADKTVSIPTATGPF